MNRPDRIKRWLARGRRYSYSLIGGLLLALLLLTALAPPQTAVVETITTPPGAAAPITNPIYFTPQLPARDADVEVTGDRLAAAALYLNKRQRGAALKAIAQAKRAAHCALEHRGGHDGGAPGGGQLFVTIQNLGAVEESIERGAFADAQRQLRALDRELDHLNE